MENHDDEDLKKLRSKKMDKLKQYIQESQQKREQGVIAINSSNFFDVINKADLSIVDLWANWCMPCKMMTPIFKKLASSQEYRDKFVFYSLNADENHQILEHYNVTGIPTFLIFSKGALLEKIIGAVGETGLKNSLNNILKKYKFG